MARQPTASCRADSMESGRWVTVAPNVKMVVEEGLAEIGRNVPYPFATRTGPRRDPSVGTRAASPRGGRMIRHLSTV
nr:hypothetical protein KitaXyl93_65360 [Kitasatospora sp. Xyl93]